MKCILLAFMLVAGSVSAAPSITGFDASRGGAFSIEEGSALSSLREAIRAAYPGVAIDSSSTISAAGLQGHNVVIISSATGGVSAITPLSAAEKTDLLNFVLAGNGALIFSDNDTFSSSASQPANLSILAPFGVTCTGTGFGWERTAQVGDPNASPVTDGPFGLVSSYSVGWSGWFSTTGSSTVLANLVDNIQPSLAVLPRGTLGPGSGSVVLFSDSTMIGDGYFPASNQALVLNALAFVTSPACVGDLNSDGLVDDTDFTIFVPAYNILDCADPTMPLGCPADLNGDSFVDDSDFTIFVVAYNELICP